MRWGLSECFRFEGFPIAWGRIGQGPPLVLLHGTPFSSYEWHRVAPHLARTHTVFFHDMLGYGRSAMPEADVSLGVQNRLLAALFAEWRVERPDVVAHDFGGATALRAHLLDRLEFCSLTLIDPVALSPWGSPLVQHVRAHEAAFAEMPAYLHAAILPAYLQSAMHRQATADVLAPYIDPWLGPEGQRGFYRQIAQMHERYTDEITEALGALRCRVQVLWGAEDQWLPLSQGQALAARLGGVPLHVVAGCGHLMQEDAPEAIVAQVLAFLGSRP